jgi:hypothetical protein
VASVGAALPDARTRLYLPFFRAARMIALEELADRRPGLDSSRIAHLDLTERRTVGIKPTG